MTLLANRPGAVSSRVSKVPGNLTRHFLSGSVIVGIDSVCRLHQECLFPNLVPIIIEVYS